MRLRNKTFTTCFVTSDYLLKVILPDPIVKSNLDCSNLALDAIKMLSSGQEECFLLSHQEIA